MIDEINFEEQTTQAPGSESPSRNVTPKKGRSLKISQLNKTEKRGKSVK